ncbi:MAG: alpha-rhamnosidase, partial [Ruminococcaceae bacterium]|nr:alpha-rhamnosidase [Oscillospiraceae bacterium]
AARAFRYVNFLGGAVKAPVAQLELLPEIYKAKFSCPDDPQIAKIFDICAYTFHLNSREFLLDGIKRDRWCWSGDAYQSYMVNDYLFADRALNRRTITALYGKPPYLEHINTINDYSAFLLIGTWEYYFTTGDMEFIRFILPRAKALYQFILDRLDENGLVVQRPGDWIFIDWSDIDKDGPLCAEQILLWQAHNAMAKLSAAVGEDGGLYLDRADKLKSVIMEKYWDAEKGAFIDSFTSGRRNVTRHASIFAILYDFVDRDTAEELVKNVLENDAVTKLTTPYFELYELMALCKLGHLGMAQEMIDSYWGGMVRLGATTIWEQYDPTESGIRHYGMYGMRFGKSLCHAWGSGPIYLLGRYVAGVYATSVGSETFAVEPNPGKYAAFDAVVPMRDGTVAVHYDHGRLTVYTELSGGVVKFGGREYALEAGKTLAIE